MEGDTNSIGVAGENAGNFSATPKHQQCPVSVHDSHMVVAIGSVLFLHVEGGKFYGNYTLLVDCYDVLCVQVIRIAVGVSGGRQHA